MSKRKLISVDIASWERISNLTGGKKLKNPVRSRIIASMIEDYHGMNGSLFTKLKIKEFNDSGSDRMIKKILGDLLE